MPTPLQPHLSRRHWIRDVTGAATSSLLATSFSGIATRTFAAAATTAPIAEIILPRNRVPLSFIIDDSTCLVNMGHFCTPQFAQCYPDRSEYQRDWKQWPREIPDAFVREFGEWCAEQGVKGKYSIVPYPACVGWLDRELPGWSKRELDTSLKLVRDMMLPNWDIHPEMITHTRVIDLKTGRPMETISPATMENSYPQAPMSVDQLASYLAYALRILKNCGLPCEGITTPGGFGNRVKQELPVAVREAVTDVFNVDCPHYFKYVRLGESTTFPELECAANSALDFTNFTVNVPAGTGDWFGGWQGVTPSQPDLYATADGTGGRMVELITQRQPAVMLCHWPGIYSNGSKEGFHSFQRVIHTLHANFGDQTIWMKPSEMARYWAVKEFAEIAADDDSIAVTSPLACSSVTLKLPRPIGGKLVVHSEGTSQVLQRVAKATLLEPGTYFDGETSTLVCVDLARGRTVVREATA